MSNSLDLTKITNLAYLNMSKAEAAKLLPKVQQVIDFVGTIQKLDLANEKDQAILFEGQRFREDKIKKQLVEIDKLSSFTEENYFVVPAVIKNLE